MPLAIYMREPEGLLGSSLAGQPLCDSASGTTTHTLWRSQYRITLKPAPWLGSLCLAYTPPQPGQVPILPVRKSYQRRKKRPAVYPPPSGAGPAITRMQKLSAVHKATPVVDPFLRC